MRKVALIFFICLSSTACSSAPSMIYVRHYSDGERRHASTETRWLFADPIKCKDAPLIRAPGYGITHPISAAQISDLDCKAFSDGYSIFVVNLDRQFLSQETTDVTRFVAFGQMHSGYLLGSDDVRVNWVPHGVELSTGGVPFERFEDDTTRGVFRQALCIGESPCPWQTEWHYKTRPPELHSLRLGEHSYLVDFIGYFIAPCLGL